MSNNTTDLNNYIANLKTISNTISFYFMVITAPVGIIGNIVSLYIYTKPALNKKTNVGFLYGWLCILDLISICNYVFITRSSVVFGYSVSMPCGLDNYTRRTAFNVTSWMQAFISFDRFVAVMFPTKIEFMKKKVIF